ncbi:MAG: hypothetical protein AB1918_06180 [Pseudomonadota bacterium]
MTIPADQQLLYSDLCAKLAAMEDEESLARTMGQILRSLLRRKGDVEFLLVVQDLATDGLAGRSLAEQKALAAEVVRLVLEKRPEVAAAWQALHAPPPGVPARRAADLEEPEPAPAPAAPPPPPESYEHAEAEAMVSGYVADVLERRLHIFQVHSTRFPTPAFRHEQPFFLFDRRFARVARRFVVEVLAPQCRPALQRRVYAQIGPRLRMDPEGLKAFLAEKRPEAWKILIERLTKWAGHHRTAEAKLAAAADLGDDAGPEYAEVEVPVSTPRVFTVLGVAFALGQKTTTRRMRVRVRASTEPSADELEALTHVTRLRNMAAEEGLDLPAACDFLFLRTLLEFDAKKYAHAVKEFVALADHAETSRQYLFERLKFLDEAYANTLSDVVILMMFHDAGHFGFKELYDICIGTALDKQAMANKRPFLQDEVGRRPRELAFQVREVLRRRYDEATLAEAVRMLLEAWAIMAKNRFQRELQAALGVLAAFPVAFAGDPDEPVLSHVGHILHRALTARETHAEETIAAVLDVYAPLAERLRASARGS